ncbi:DNA-binding response regulator [Sinosporangium siamense]|uniref:DNA-binding response regulator n=1 Tax=Sinosporangium siamense TaxID=1367973 RepID=A0A919RL82_9ACTN|nr:DNA-binding response regulator [Sinosporangium siamense]
MAEVVARYLERDGHEVECAGDGEEALRRARTRRPDLVVLDLTLPDMDGLLVCRRLRELGPIPVIMLAALGEEMDRLVGAETGADDYLAKPFSPRELALRVRSALRESRSAPVVTGELSDGDLVLSADTREARLGGQELQLTAKEFDLLAHMMTHPRQAFSRAALLDRVWGWSFGDSATVTVHVRRLREKIEADPATPSRIITVWGVGYRYQPSS